MSTHYYRFTHRSSGAGRRSPLLERLLARAGAPTEAPDWRSDAFRVIAPESASMPGVGAAALCAERGSVDAATVFVATPVHYVAEMSNVRLDADGILSLRRPEADTLAADFNRVWHDAGLRLLPGRCARREGGMPERVRLFCLSERALEATTRDPEDALGRHIDSYLPAGPDAARLRRLMSEIEMWLFEHAVNRARTAGGAAPVVSGLWMWGGGPALRSVPPIQGWTAGDDLFFAAFAARPERTCGGHADAAATPGAAATAGAGAAAGAGATLGAGATPPGVVVIAAEPGTDAWRAAESRWLERSVADLRSGRIRRLDLSAGSRCFSVRRGWDWRAWRRRRPWWESFT